MNFTSNVYTGFRPYTPENPVEAELMVGTQRQGSLESGIQKVQGFFDTLHGFDIAKDVTKQYIQGKISDLKTSINNISGDFSDQRLVSQIGGLAGKIASDPIVENGIVSTAAYRKGVADIENSKKVDKEGKGGGYAIQNEWDFMEGAQKWLNDGDFTSSFSGTYTPHTDYMKRFTDAYKEIHPDSSLTQDQVRINDGTGQIEVLNEKTREGIDANEVSRLWNTISADPAVQQQLSIDGRYKYRGMGPEDMYNHLTEDYSRNIDGINSKIKDIQQRAAVDKTISPREVASAVEALRKQGSQYAEQYKQIATMIPGVEGGKDQNLDAAKAAIFSTDVASSLAGTYSWSKNTDKIVDSPLFKAHMEQAKYELDLSKFDEEVRHNKATEEAALINAAIKEEGSSLKKPGKGTTATGTEFKTREDQVDQSVGEAGSKSYYDKTHDLESQLNSATRQMIFNIANKGGLPNPFVMVATPGAGPTLQYNPNYPGGPEAAKAAGASIYQDARLGIINGTHKDWVADEFANVDPLVRKVNNRYEIAKAKEKEFAPQMGDIASKYGKPIDRRMLDYWTVQNRAPGWEQAQQRLASMPDLQQFTQDLIGTSPATPGGYTHIPGKLEKEYYNLASFLNKNKDVTATLQKREDAFKQLQTGFNPTVTTISTPDAKERETWSQNFLALAQKYNVNDNAKDFEKLLRESSAKDKAGAEANLYQIIYDKNTENWKLRLTRADGKTADLPVSEADVQSLNFQTRDPFWDKFGDDLSLSANTTTDVNGRGIASAYMLPKQQGSRYDVRYHLAGDGKGSYDMRLWIYDNLDPKRPKLVADGTPIGGYWNSETIMNRIQQGFTDDQLRDIISQNR